MRHLMLAILLVLPNAIVAEDEPGNTQESPAEASESKRLTADEALDLVRKHIQKEMPDAELDDAALLKELTTEAIWKKLKIQVFQARGDVLLNETFVVRDKQVFPIGKAFGGSGVNSLCVADLDRDKEFELVYSFAYGSGVHRSCVAVFKPLAKKPVERVCPLTNFSFDDFAVKSIDDQTVHIFAARTRVGAVVLEKEDDKLSATIRLDDKLPAELRAKLIAKP
jgi:hypothetical protein